VVVVWVAGDARYDARYDAKMRWLRRVGNGGHGILPYCMQNDRWLGADARAGCCVDSVAGSFARAEERREESVPSGYTGFSAERQVSTWRNWEAPLAGKEYVSVVEVEVEVEVE